MGAPGTKGNGRIWRHIQEGQPQVNLIPTDCRIILPFSTSYEKAGHHLNRTSYSGQIATLAFIVILAVLVWNYYKAKKSPLEQRYRTFGPRFWTWPVDSCVLLPLTTAISMLQSLNLAGVLAASLVIVENLAWLIYTVTMHARYGQTVGKMVTKVRVVDSRTEGRISWCQASIREGIPMILSLGIVAYEVHGILSGRFTARALENGEAFNNNELFWLLSGIPGLWFLAEVLTMLTNRKRRALHDFIAGTVVVRTNVDYGNALSEKATNPGPGVQAPVPVA
jgi:uncharacterized RDD family membrane protein YckC